MSNRRRTALSVIAFVGLMLLAFELVLAHQIPYRSPMYPVNAPIDSELDRPSMSGDPCLHGPGEVQEEAARRSQATAAARAINKAQMQNRTQTGSFLNVADILQLPDLARLRETARDYEVAPGWRLRVWTAIDGYTFTITDTTDPCSFAYFSDDRALVHVTQPVR
jgi:hypothetical protein